MHCLVALPAYNEAETIASVLRQIPRTLPGVDSMSILVVDDGSRDDTASVAERSGAQVLRLGHHRGLGVAFRAAVDQALDQSADVLVTIDADGQFQPEEIPLLLDPIQKGRADCVTGSRFIDGRQSPDIPTLRRFGNRLMAFAVSRLVGRRLADVSCGFRAYGREALLRLNLHGDFTYTQEAILDLCFKGLRIIEVPVTVTYSADRQSRIARSLWSYGWQTLKIIVRTARDYKPMKFFGGSGIVLFLIGLALEFWLLMYFLTTQSLTPYKFIGFIGLGLNGIGLILFVVGLLADMLYRVRQNQERLLYAARSRNAPSKFRGADVQSAA